MYAVGHTALSMQGKCLAAVLACGPRALLSHVSAAWLWGVSRRSPVPFEVTARTSQAPKPSIVLHRSRVLREEDRALCEGIPATSLPRTLLDVSAAGRFEHLRRMLERAEELRIFDLRAVEALLARSQGHPGVGRLRRALALYRPVPFTRSGLERRFLEVAADAGLPPPCDRLQRGWI
ncbi:MAG TPA: hypothetical protein VG518_00690 [Solirubrobacterales bacterium]|nr:hypothetical protein [Solirubrobacterales bacterium]